LNGSEGFALVGVEASVEPVAHDTWGAYSVGDESASTMHAWPLQFCGIAPTNTTVKKKTTAQSGCKMIATNRWWVTMGMQC
jgi:hypothetical protein